jgi:hypothetical protein
MLSPHPRQGRKRYEGQRRAWGFNLEMKPWWPGFSELRFALGIGHKPSSSRAQLLNLSDSITRAVVTLFWLAGYCFLEPKILLR